MDFLLHRAIAHRGLHDNIRIAENSLMAFQCAIDKGFPIELDVHLLTDGGIAVFHDDNLFRMTGVDRKLAECSREDLRGLLLLGTPDTIPLLEEVLELVDAQVPLLIELKNDTPVGQLESALLARLRGYRGAYAVESFDPFRVWWFCRNAPEVCRGQLAATFIDRKFFFLKKKLLKNMCMNCLTKPHFIAYDIGFLPNRAVQREKRQGRAIFGWTVKNRAQYERMKGICDSIIFEGFLPEGIRYPGP